MHNEVAYNSDIPRYSCLCEICENASLLAKGINSSFKSTDILSFTAHTLVETYTCDSSSKDCMLGNCKAFVDYWKIGNCKAIQSVG